MNTRLITLDGAVKMSTMLGLMAQVRDLIEESPNEDIYFFINSYGGSVTAMLTFIDFAKNCPCDFITVVSGKAMSAGAVMATVIAPKGKRLSTANSRFMYHDISSGAFIENGNSDNIAVTEYLRDSMLELVYDATGASREEIISLMDRDKYISAPDLVAMGWIDGIIGTDRGMDV